MTRAPALPAGEVHVSVATVPAAHMLQSPGLDRVLFVTSECTPFAMTGGLGDVSSALPMALRRRGLDVRVVMPLYACVPREHLELIEGLLWVQLGGKVCATRLWQGELRSGVPVYFIEHDQYYGRAGLYGPNGSAFDDNLDRFAFLSRAALDLCKKLRWVPDIAHANDWPTALVPMFLRTRDHSQLFSRCASLLTIHNMGFQGVFPTDMLARTGLGPELLTANGIEHFGSINLLKGGIQLATLVSTVSPGYAREIQTSGYGCGLDGVLYARRDDLAGILNGIDEEEWSPVTDPFLPARYSVSDLSGKAICKEALQREAALAVDASKPLVGVIGRLTYQKGMDVLVRSLELLSSLDFQMVVLGAGDTDIEQQLRDACLRWPGRFFASVGGFDRGLAHRIEAGCDFLLMPSRYEPCGLNQMYSLRYGTLPIVRATGGLEDTVVHYDEATGEGTGFKFHDLDPAALHGVLSWALTTWRERPAHIDALRKRGMTHDLSWSAAAGRYQELYERAVTVHRAAPPLQRTAS